MSEETNKELTAEELAEMKEMQLKFYEENTPILTKQVEFEELKARLEKAKLEQLQSRLQRIGIELSLKERDEEDISEQSEENN